MMGVMAFGDVEERGELQYCVSCEVPRILRIVGETHAWDENEGSNLRTVLLRCPECSQCQLHEQSSRHEGYNEITEELRRVYPTPGRPLHPAIPLVLRTELNEARACFSQKYYTAAAVLVRRTLEGVCDDKGVHEKTLYLSVRKMQELDLLDDRLVEWSQELRAVGNQGAHFTKERVTREDAEDALSFIEALLDYLYVLTQRFEEFKERRAKPPATDAAADGLA